MKKHGTKLQIFFFFILPVLFGVIEVLINPDVSSFETSTIFGKIATLYIGLVLLWALAFQAIIPLFRMIFKKK